MPAKPPKKYQWKPGQSGNPKGRPPGSKNISTILRELMELEVETTDPVTGERISAPGYLLVSKRLLRKALDGNDKSITEIFDRLEGRPAQKIDVKGDTKLFLEDAIKRSSGEGKNG